MAVITSVYVGIDVHRKGDKSFRLTTLQSNTRTQANPIPALVGRLFRGYG